MFAQFAGGDRLATTIARRLHRPAVISLELIYRQIVHCRRKGCWNAVQKGVAGVGGGGCGAIN